MTRTLAFALALGLGLSWTSTATAQSVGYAPVRMVALPPGLHPAHAATMPHAPQVSITSHPYHEAIFVRRVAPTYGTADGQPMLPSAYGCNGHCMPHGLPARSTVLQPVAVPSVSYYQPSAIPTPVAVPVPAYPPTPQESPTEGYNVGRGLFGSPKFYRTGEPIRNMLRFLTL